MSQILISLCYWLHALATVVFIGHFMLISVLYFPVLSQNGDALSAISKRSRPWLYASLVVFAITGIYLTLVDPNYLGLGNFGNFWGIVMLVKHILILGMVGVGFWYHAILRIGLALQKNEVSAETIARFRGYNNAMAVMGAVVLLLTALAQVK